MYFHVLAYVFLYFKLKFERWRSWKYHRRSHSRLTMLRTQYGVPSVVERVPSKWGGAKIVAEWMNSSKYTSTRERESRQFLFSCVSSFIVKNWRWDNAQSLQFWGQQPIGNSPCGASLQLAPNLYLFMILEGPLWIFPAAVRMKNGLGVILNLAQHL